MHRSNLYFKARDFRRIIESILMPFRNEGICECVFFFSYTRALRKIYRNERTNLYFKNVATALCAQINELFSQSRQNKGAIFSRPPNVIQSIRQARDLSPYIPSPLNIFIIDFDLNSRLVVKRFLYSFKSLNVPSLSSFLINSRA